MKNPEAQKIRRKNSFFKQRIVNIMLLSFTISFMVHANESNRPGKKEKSPVQKTNPATIISHESWAKVVNKKDYTEHFKERKPSHRTKKRHFNLGGLGAVLKILLYIGGVLFLALLVFLVLKYVFNYFGEKVTVKKEFASFENLDEKIHETDLERFLRIALDESNFAQCVRVYYLMVIKALSDARLIDWKRDKTNHSYVMEMASRNGGPQFMFLTNVYERVWFGNSTLDNARFASIETIFKQYLTLISKDEA